MSDTKPIVNLLEASQRARFSLEATVEELRTSLSRSQSDANRVRSEARNMADQLDRIGTGLRDFLNLAMQAAEDRPGHAPHAARVRQARAAVQLFDAVIGGDRG